MDSDRNRKAILEQLIDFADSIDVLKSKVCTLPRNAEEPLVTMTNGHALSAIKRVLSHQVEPTDLSLWADLIEMREDVDIQGGRNGPLRQFIYETATPEFYPVTMGYLSHWESELKRPIPED